MLSTSLHCSCAGYSEVAVAQPQKVEASAVVPVCGLCIQHFDNHFHVSFVLVPW